VRLLVVAETIVVPLTRQNDVPRQDAEPAQ
jgi:hypothetical protein